MLFGRRNYAALNCEHFRHQIRRPSEPLGQDADQALPIVRKPLQKGVKVITLNHKQRAWRSRPSGGRARLIVEDRDLTQHVATLKPLDDHIAILGWHQNLNGSSQDNE
jgi:hypothetical protein